jgi:hypothetical protein
MTRRRYQRGTMSLVKRAGDDMSTFTAGVKSESMPSAFPSPR